MKIVGDWERGEIVHGKWIFPNGTYFEGNFEKNFPKSFGKWNFVNGNVNEGEYIHTESRVGGTGLNKNDIYTKLSWCPKEEIFDPKIHKISG